MPRNVRKRQRGFAVVTMTALVALSVATGGSAVAASPGHGNDKRSQGQNNGHGSTHHKPQKHEKGGKGLKQAPGSSGSQGGSSGPKSNGGESGNSSSHGQGNSSNGGSGNSSNHAHNGQKTGHDSHGTSGSNVGGGKGSPAGNNGTVKIDGVDFDSHPNNEPHVGCVFQVDFYGFDEGVGNATVAFADHSPTSDGGLTVTSGQGNPSSVFIGEDDASGGGSEAGLDASETYTLAFIGTPHPKQGYHVKLTVNAPGSQGADIKHKVFWVKGCGENPPPPPTQCPDGSNPGDTNGDGVEDAADCSTSELCPDGSAPSDLDGDGEVDDCDFIGPPPSSSPFGGLAVTCKGIVTVTLDNRKSTVERFYYLEREMGATAAQAWAFKVDGGSLRELTRKGSPGDVFTLSIKNKELGTVTVPARCGNNPPVNPPTPPQPPTNPPVSPPGPPTSIASGVDGVPAIASVQSNLSGNQSLVLLLGLMAILSGFVLMGFARVKPSPR